METDMHTGRDLCLGKDLYIFSLKLARRWET